MARTKDLCEVVLDALGLHAGQPLPELGLGSPKRRLVVGSGNGLAAGRIIFADEDTVFADEGQYERTIDEMASIDGAVVVSASGEKDAPEMVEYLDPRTTTYLLTCREDSTAAQYLKERYKGRVVVTPSNEEPITYNTSTYLGMVLAKTQEDPRAIRAHIEGKVEPLIPPDLTMYGAFYLIVRPEFDAVREMLLTKFDELFGPMLNGRCYTWGQTLHAKNVVESDKELYVSFGYDNELFGYEDCRLHIPLPEPAGFAAMIAIGYYVIGRIQSQFPPWFKWNADRYASWQKMHLP